MPPRPSTNYSPSLLMQLLLSLRSLARSTRCRRRNYSYCHFDGFTNSSFTGSRGMPSCYRSNPDSTESDPDAGSVEVSDSSDSSWDRGSRSPRRAARPPPTDVPGPCLSFGNPPHPQTRRQRTYETINDGRSVEEAEFDFQAVDQQAPSRFNANAATFVPMRPPPGLCDGIEDAKLQLTCPEASLHKSRDPEWRKPQPRISNANPQLKWGLNLRETLIALSEGREPCETRNNTKDSHFVSRQKELIPKIRHVWRGALPGNENSFRSNMKKMARYSQEQILFARRINKLGFNSAHFLELHFRNFGRVEAVFASHSIDKANQCRDRPRVRPAGVAFVVMGTVQQVRAVMDAGTVQNIHGVDVTIGKYEGQQIFHDDQAEFEDKVFDEYTRWVDRGVTALAG